LCPSLTVTTPSCFHDTSKGQADPLGISLAKTGFWTQWKVKKGGSSVLFHDEGVIWMQEDDSFF
jgi:hypothetical protein